MHSGRRADARRMVGCDALPGGGTARDIVPANDRTGFQETAGADAKAESVRAPEPPADEPEQLSLF